MDLLVVLDDSCTKSPHDAALFKPYLYLNSFSLSRYYSHASSVHINKHELDDFNHI